LNFKTFIVFVCDISFMMKNKIVFIFFAWFLSFSFTGCIKEVKEKNSDLKSQITVLDFRGRQLNFEKPVNRIVCLIESALSGFYMIGAGNKIIGISTNVYGDVALEYAALDKRIESKMLPAPGNWDFVSIENIVALQPDIVIMWASQVESIASVESKGIPVYAVMLKSTDDIYKEIVDFGKLTGYEKRADAIIQYTKNEIKDIAQKNKNLKIKKQKVYFMWSQGPLETSGTGSTVNELIEMAGAKNACPSEDEHLVANLEKVIGWNPDLILMWCNFRRTPDDIRQLSGWSGIAAVKHNQVYELPSVFLCDLWTLKFQYTVKLLSNWCYPDKDANFDLEKEKKDMLFHLYGKVGEQIR